MKISFITLFPEMFEGPLNNSIIKRTREKGLLDIEYINIRNFGIGRHQMVDDTPYGGGIGMVMRVDVLHKALISCLCNKGDKCREKIIFLSASGKLFTQQKALEYSAIDHLVLVCGHYEGIDERIKKYIDEEISIGNFVVTGGELPAMLIADATARLITGALKTGATESESFSYAPEGKKLLEYPQYTKPDTYDGIDVPRVLLSGNHKAIDTWRKNEAVKKTEANRPDII